MARHARSGGGDPHTLVGAYVMDAVSAADRASFERHLAGCETCRAEVRGLREATARLAAAAAVQPRAELREQTIRAAARIRQLPPRVPAAPAGRRRAGAGAVSRLRARGESSRGGSARGGRAWGGWLPRLAVALAIFLALVTVGLGTAMHGAEQRLDAAQGSSHRIAAVLGAPDAVMLTSQVAAGGSATVVMSHRMGELVLTAARLPGLPAARAYQVWVMGGAAPRSAGLLAPGRDGTGGPMLVTGLASGDEVGVTVEPAGGSARPTTAPIVLLDLH